MRRSVALKLAGVGLVFVGAVALVAMTGIEITDFAPSQAQAFVLRFGVWAPVIYLVIYAQPVVPLPVSVLTVTGGLAFGKGWGACAAFLGATLRACTGFYLARMLGREAVAKLLMGRVEAVDRGLSRHAFKAVLLIRLIPNVPYDIQNYTLGLSRVRFAPYILATMAGIIPGTVAFVYLGDSLADPQHIWQLAAAIVLLIIVGAIPRFWRSQAPRVVPADTPPRAR